MATVPANSALPPVASTETDASPNWLSPAWHDRLVRLIAQGKKAKTLSFLEQAITRTMPLFGDDPLVFEARRDAWLTRTHLLLEWGRAAEALAWTCLECQIGDARHQAVPEAKALRDRLLRQLSLDFTPTPVAVIADEMQWPGVAGMYDLKARLERDLISSIRYPQDAARYGITPPNGILLYGPPGCGKTFIARKIAAKLGYHFVEIKPGDVASPYIHGTQGMIADVFAKAAETAPTVLFFDEMDAFAPRRGDLNHSYATEANEFLVRLDNCAQRRILVIAATNYPEKIDPAVLRAGRIELHFLVGLPDFSARADMFRHHVEKLPHRRLTWEGLAEISEGYTAADIAYLCQQAARLALADSKKLRVYEEVLISPPHFELAMREFPPRAIVAKHTQIGFRAAPH